MSAPPPLPDCGFVRVPTRDGSELWMRCDQCGKADHFWIDDAVRCRCGAAYGHARRPDGARIPLADLRFVPFSQGPASLASLQWDSTAILLVLFALLGLGGILAWGWLG